MTEITGLIASIKAVTDIAKGLKSVYDHNTVMERTNQITERLSSVLQEMLTLQEEHSALLQEKDKLEKVIANNNEWAITKSQYKLEEISAGSFVYVPNESHPSPEPKHWLCQNCLDNERKKSILQLEQKMLDGSHLFRCAACKSFVKDRSHQNPIQPRRSRGLKW